MNVVFVLFLHLVQWILGQCAQISIGCADLFFSFTKYLWCVALDLLLASKISFGLPFLFLFASKIKGGARLWRFDQHHCMSVPFALKSRVWLLSGYGIMGPMLVLSWIGVTLWFCWFGLFSIFYSAHGARFRTWVLNVFCPKIKKLHYLSKYGLKSELLFNWHDWFVTWEVNSVTPFCICGFMWDWAEPVFLCNLENLVDSKALKVCSGSEISSFGLF